MAAWYLVPEGDYLFVLLLSRPHTHPTVMVTSLRSGRVPLGNVSNTPQSSQSAEALPPAESAKEPQPPPSPSAAAAEPSVPAAEPSTAVELSSAPSLPSIIKMQRTCEKCWLRANCNGIWVMLLCDHTFHDHCVRVWQNVSGNNTCPVCQTIMQARGSVFDPSTVSGRFLQLLHGEAQ